MYTYTCQRCSGVFESTSHNRKYCPECAEEVNRQHIRKQNKAKVESSKKPKAEETPAEKHETIIGMTSLKGKTLGKINAEARALGMTYGTYVAAVESGMINQMLRCRSQPKSPEPDEGPRKVWAKPEKLTLAAVKEYQNRMNGPQPMSAKAFKSFCIEFRDRYGLSEKDAMNLLFGIGVEGIIRKGAAI